MAQQFESNDDYPPRGTPIRRRRHFGPPNIDPADCSTTYILYDTRVILADTVIVPRPRRTRPPTASLGDQMKNVDSSDDDSDSDDDEEYDTPREQSNHAFWSQRQVKAAIYGGVYSGVILRRCHEDIRTPNGQSVQWEATEQRCAIKQYNRNRVQEAEGSAEDPNGEIAAMQYLANYQRHHLQQAQGARILEGENILQAVQDNMYDCNVMMPLGVYYDTINVYSVMPYVDGGELFDVLDDREHFSEAEARHWLHQIMNGLEHLQRAGICHRDMSLENILTDREGRALVIDLGMCLKIPYMDDVQHEENPIPNYQDHRQRQRCFIRRNNTCGKVSFKNKSRDCFSSLILLFFCVEH